MNPRFSIIIPVYNLENYISQCLDSVLMQTFQSWEAIVVNDGSSDKSLEIIQSYASKDDRFKIIDKSNGGLSAARNDGMNLCSGDYIIFLDGDDWLDIKALEVTNSLIDNSEVDLLVHQMNYYFSKDDCIVRNTKIREGKYTSIDFLHTVLLNKEYNFVVACAKAYRREFIDIHKLRFILGILHEDGPFFYEVCHKANKVIFSTKALYYYRQNREGQITSVRTYKNYKGVVRGINNTLDLYGIHDKIINGVVLNLYTFQAGNYETIKERNKAFHELRKWDTRKLLLHLIINSNVNFNTRMRGVLLIIDPLLLNKIYKLWF